MKAYGSSFSIIRNNLFYEIPFFQRKYVWKEENWRELLNSLSDPDDCPFLGSIILKENKASDGKFSWTVIDGQQRLTTLSVLMRACFDELWAIKDTEKYRSEQEDENPFYDEVATPFRETTRVKVDNEKITKIIHSHIDHTDFDKVMNGDYRDLYSNIELDKVGGIVQCYCYFRKELKEKYDTVQVIWDYLTQKIDDHYETGKYLVVIELGTEENEQAIFDTINSAGVRLTCADTIKNTLFQSYIELLEKEGVSKEKAQSKAIELYDTEWDSVFSRDQENVEYWDKAKSVGRLYRDNIEILLHCIAVIQGFFDPDVKKMSDLPQCYKDCVAGFVNSNEIKALIKDINAYAKLYREYFKEMGSFSYDISLYIPRIMQISDTLQISTFYPYILYLAHLKEHSGVDVKDRFRELEQYLILHAICGESTKNYNKECVQLIKGATIKSLLENCKIINSDTFEYGLRHISIKLATLLLFWVELYKRYTENSDIKKLDYKFTLEHIMPQQWEQHWFDVPVYDENGAIVNDDEHKKIIRTEAINEIGNMTLLNSKLNSSVSNNTFRIKLEGEGKKKGMKDLADCLITRELLHEQCWNEQTIRRRTAELSQIVKKLWGSLLN